MQLKRLEAYGFKSFADKLAIDFEQGITAIVGPNGSGKSNITDAIRWALGEPNVRNLRAAKAEEIIFSGSGARRSLGAAEVSLIFDNCDGALAVDFQEVVVTRRLFRSGESEFFINKARCRLKDIYDLFADTGLGKDAISVISQNKIDQILNSRPEERRLLFEEVAGITKYRNRKRESLKKLEDTQQNVLRAEDLINELESQLEPLAKRADETRRYNELSELYRKCKITLLVNRHDEQNQALAACVSKQQNLQQLNDTEQNELQLQEVAKERFNNELLEVEKSLQLLAVKNNELTAELDSNNNKTAVLQERLRQSAENKERIAKTAAELAEKNQAAAVSEQTARQELANAKVNLTQVQAESAAAQQAQAALQAKIGQAQELAAKRQQQSFQQAQQLLQRQNDLSADKKSLQELAKASAELVSKRQALAKQDDDYAANYTQRQMKLSELSQKLQQLYQRQSDSESRLKHSYSERQTAQQQFQQLNQQYSSAKTRLEFLKGMQAEYEGFGRAVKFVLKNNEPWQQGICGAVAEVIKIKNEYINAIEIALGGSLQNIITENDQIAKQAINFLKQAKVGRVTFLPLNTITVTESRFNPQIAKQAGFIGYANKLVNCAAKYQKIIDFLLGRTLIVDNIDTALLLARQYNYRLRIVTLAGEMLNPGGSMTGGGNARREVGFLNRAGEIGELTARLIEYESAVKTADDKLSSIAAAINELKAAGVSETELVRQLEIKQAQQTVYAEKAAAEHEAVKHQLQELTAKLDAAAALQQNLTLSVQTAEQTISQLQSMTAVNAQADQQAAEILANLQTEKEKLTAAVVEQKIAETVANQEIIRINDIVSRSAAESEQYLAAQTNLRAELAAINQAAIAYQQEKEQLAKAAAEIQSLKRIGTKDYDNFHQVKLDKLAAIQAAEQKIRETRKHFNDIQNQLHQLELTYAKYDFAVKNTLENLRTEYGKSLAAARECCLAEGTAVLHNRCDELQQAMAQLGPINPNAISDYEAVNNRYVFMKQQAEDLVLAREYLLGIIKEIDATMSKQFTAAFAAIGECFSKIFVQLFGGGTAKLTMSDTDSVLDTGIEIMVQPPNKKAQSLAVLSGGERALTVIALLFAFLQFRPAPFSVVDEIDASLDEANVERFAEFLKEYAANTQFIVVTHRKGTMQAADIMHGVTVDAAGVSKVISVKFADQL